jgi:photosystem II stability/assembly factor-like uncharacterized protein
MLPAIPRLFAPALTFVIILFHTFPAFPVWDVFRIPQQGGTESIIDLNFINDQEGWFLAPGPSGYDLYQTTNAAGTIVLASTGEADLNDGFIDARSRIHFRSPSLGYLLTNDLFDEFLYKTEDGGESFSKIETPFENVYAMHLLEGDQLWITGRRGPSSATSVVAYSANGGIDWEVHPTPYNSSGIDPTEIYFFDAQNGWLGGGQGRMLYTHDGGQSWAISRTGTTSQINAIRFADPLHGWAVGTDGLILVTKDGGKNWIHQLSRTTENLYDLEVLDASRVFAVGGRIFSDDTFFQPSNLLVTEDGGANWFQESLPFTTNLRCIQILGNDIWIGGAGGRNKGDMFLFHRKLAGHDSPVITLRSLPPGVRDFPYEDSPIEALFGAAPYTWSLSGGVGLFIPPGMTINSQTGVLEGTPTSPGDFSFRVNVADVNGATDSAVFGLTVASAPFSAGTDPLPPATHRKTYRAGIDFSGGNSPYDARITSGELPPGITLDPNLVLAGTPLEVGDYDFVLQVSDRSSPPHRANFNLSIHVSPLEDPEWEVQHAHNRLMDIHFFDAKEGISFGWSGVILRTLDSGRTWNATSFGRTLVKSSWIGDEGWMIGENKVFHSTDRGNEWEELPHPLAFIEGVHFYDTQRGWIYGEGIAYTTNGGQSWDLATVPNSNVIFSLDFADPMVGYAGSGEAMLLKSTDGGVNWSPVVVQGLNDGTKSTALGPPRSPSSPFSPSIAPGKGPLSSPR